jgi:DNA invertase Pin-like site-specific DNA recombinase
MRPEDNRALAYVRVSTVGQDRYSPPTQIRYCQDYAAHHGLQIIDFVHEAASALKAKRRPLYEAMIGRLVREKIPNLIFYLPDRIARNLDDWIPLRNAGVRMHDAVKNDSFCPLDPNDYKKVADFEYELIRARLSSEETRQRVTDAWVTQTDRGRFPHRRTLGYEPERLIDAGQVAITTKQDAERALIMRLLFRHVLTTGERNWAALTRRARELGLRTRSGRVVHLSSIMRYLRDPYYCGRVRLKGKVVCQKGEQEPIVTPQEFDEVQAILNSKRLITRQGQRYPYWGLLECDYCKMSVIRDGHGKHSYYRCSGGRSTDWYQAHFGRPKCPLYYGPYFKQAEIDEFLELMIGELYVDPETYEYVRAEIEEDYKNLKTLNADEAKTLQDEHKKNLVTQDALALRLSKANEAVIPALERQIAALESENQRIEARLEELKNGEQAVSLEEIGDCLELAKSLKETYLAASPEKREKLNRLMFRTIRVARKDSVPSSDEGDDFVTSAPFYIVWNEPFKSLAEIGFIHGLDRAKDEVHDTEERPELVKTRIRSASRISNAA